MKTPPLGTNLGDAFDAIIRSLDGLPDVVKTQPSPLRVMPNALATVTQTFVVQTYRHKDLGDTILIEYMDASGRPVRLALPPAVADTIARQRDALSTKNRKRGAQQAVQTRAERGIVPGFLKNRKEKRS